jgi:hypothetical protein
MSDQKLSDYLREWGFDVEAFEKRAKQSMDTARGDLSEVSGALRTALGEARQVLVNLKQTGGPAASELKTGFEQAWSAMESAFGRAKERMKEKPAPTPEPEPEPPASDDPPPDAHV